MTIFFRSSLLPKKEIVFNEEPQYELIGSQLIKTNKYTITEEDIKNGFVTNNVEYCIAHDRQPQRSNTLIDDMKNSYIQEECKWHEENDRSVGTYEECLKDERMKEEAEYYINDNFACGQKSITTKIDKPVEDKKDNVEVVNVPSTSLNADTIMLWVALLVTAICSFALYITVKSKKAENK